MLPTAAPSRALLNRTRVYGITLYMRRNARKLRVHGKISDPNRSRVPRSK